MPNSMPAEIKSRVPQVGEELQFLEKSIVTLSELTDALTQRLTSVVFDCPGKAVGDGSPEKNIVPLASSIRETRYRIESITERIQSLLTRIEL